MSDCIDRITDYLCLGGTFNPEMMDHKKVSQLLYDCRKELALEKEKGKMLKENLEKFCEPSQEFYVSHYVDVRDDKGNVTGKVGVIKNIVQLANDARAALKKLEEMDAR